MSSNNKDKLAESLYIEQSQLNLFIKWKAEGKTIDDYIELKKQSVNYFKLRIDMEK